MARALVAIVAALCTVAIVYGQPIQCHSDIQCEKDYYCVQDVFVCRKCLNCEELKREPPLVPTSCVKSLVMCGGCIDGLVEDRSDLSAVCVPPDYTNTTTPWWPWVVGVGVVIVVVVLVALYLWYYVPNIGPKIFNRIQEVIDFPATSTSVQHAFNPGAPVVGHDVPSAPDCPPPYCESASPLADNPVYLSDYDGHNSGEAIDPFIKRAPTTRGPQARESAGGQAASVFNKPYYDNETTPGDAAFGDEHDAFTLDEDTMESTWSPGENAHAIGGAESDAGDAAGAGGAPADMSALITALRPRQDTNNNRNGSDPSPIGPSEGGASSSITCPVIINVVQTIGSLQQTNKFSH